MKRLDPNLGFIDHVLASLACLLAVYSIGMSLTNSGLAIFFTVGILVAATTGFALSRLVTGTKIANYDSYFWAVSGMLTTGLINVLNDMLPGGGFPFELLAAGILCWVLLVGNLFAWRDQTLIFLSLPCIAIFGLVGTFDTFVPATVFFFIFMLTIAVLYARIHQRSMIDRAKRAGIEEPELLRRGPWKWMAGPEWAVASALTIILFSFMGAPILRGSLRNVAGKVQVVLPQQQQNQPSQSPQEVSAVRVGTGPTSLTDQLVVKVQVDRPRYMRMNAFSTYTGGGWRASQVSLPAGTPLVDHRPDEQAPVIGPHRGLVVWPGHDVPPHEPIENGKEIAFTLKDSNSTFRSIITPGPIVEVMGGPSAFEFLAQGWVNLNAALARDDQLTSYAIVPTEGPEDRQAKLPPALEPISVLFLAENRITSRVRDLAYKATAGATTDYEKAEAIKREIERRVVYNIRAGRTPGDQDPVEYFLFESKEGYCDLFASSMALMARSVGLPSRYVIGYIVNDPKRDADGYFTIRQRDYHAWCEIYFEGVGWIPFDPTEGAASVGGAERGAGGGVVDWYRSDLFKGVLIAVFVFALAAPVYMAVRQKNMSPAERAEKTASDVARLHTVFYRTIERYVGSPKRFSQTTREFVLAFGTRLGPTFPDASALVTDFEAAMYSPRTPDKDGLTELSKRTTDLRAALGRLKKQRP